MEQNLGPQGPGGRKFHIAHRRSPSELTPLMSKFLSPFDDLLGTGNIPGLTYVGLSPLGVRADKRCSGTTRSSATD